VNNKIVISNNLSRALEETIKEINTQNYIILEYDDFKIENAHELINHAYIASEEKRYLIAKFNTINTVSQNALLKLLEETPKNIIIIFIAKAKSIFLPTIRSRMVFEIKKYEEQKKESIFDFKKLDTKNIYQFLKNIKTVEKETIKQFIYDAFDYYQSFDNHKQEELELFDKALRLIELNSLKNAILSEILLMLLLKKSK